MTRRLVPPVVLATLVAAGCSGGVTGCTKEKPRATTPFEQGGRAQITQLTGGTTKKAAACGPRGLPPDRHFVAEGHCARVVAHNQGQLRGITFAPNGDLLAVTTDGEGRGPAATTATTASSTASISTAARRPA